MSKQLLKIIAGTPDRPLIIGDIEIHCYVLEDETRVLSQGSVLAAMGRGDPGSLQRSTKVGNLPLFLAANNLKPFVSKELEKSGNAILFQGPRGRPGHGYKATLLPEICNVYLAARAAGVLTKKQAHIAERCELVIRGLAAVGIIALVDEATGYQRIREERALATILEQFIAKELQPYTRTFPYEFYQEIFRLKGWPGPDGQKRPIIIAQYTNDFIYARLAPGVLDELKRINPTIAPGRRRHLQYRWFTPEPGYVKLNQHITAVMALMRASPNWTAFQRNLNRAFPLPNAQTSFLPDED